LEAVLNMSLRYACYVDEAFSSKEGRGLLSSNAGVLDYQLMD
jgi:hypothetical protein